MLMMVDALILNISMKKVGMLCTTRTRFHSQCKRENRLPVFLDPQDSYQALKVYEKVICISFFIRIFSASSELKKLTFSTKMIKKNSS